MAATKQRRRLQFHVWVPMVLLAGVMIVGFQNCAVDLLSSTPGASSLGACAAIPAQAAVDIQPVISNVLITTCATCHGVNNGSVKSGFYVSDPGAVVTSPAVQAFNYTQLCVRGGKKVGLKIDGSTSHTGGVFDRSGPVAPLFTFLTTYF